MLTKTITLEEKSAQKQEMDQLRAQVARLQRLVMERRIPVGILLEGWGASGKGSVIASLIFSMDPRGFRVHNLESTVGGDYYSPWAKYGTKLPAYGEIAVWNRSWYRQLTDKPTGKWNKEAAAWIKTFERQFTDDGGILVKLFLDISKKEQKKRFEKLLSSKDTRWRVTEAEKSQNKRYDAYEKRFAKMLAETDFDFARWTVIPAGDKKAAVRQVYQAVIQGVSQGLDRQAAERTGVYTGGFSLGPREKIARLDTTARISQEGYQRKLAELRMRISRLHNLVYKKRIPVVVCYEGWDAAGKGGNIKRLTRALDPRGYEVFPIAAPDKTELSHHYLWRFCNRLPKAGHIAVFDRTWYGRVMVERIEGFCSEVQWQRAFGEINEFEYGLCQWGAVVLKFFLNIDKDEQKRRFESRESTPEKQWKLTEEDWRNREKWAQYETAIDDMLAYTSTEFAPWHVIPSNDKKYARIQVMELFAEALEKRLGKKEFLQET